MLVDTLSQLIQFDIVAEMFLKTSDLMKTLWFLIEKAPTNSFYNKILKILDDLSNISTITCELKSSDCDYMNKMIDKWVWNFCSVWWKFFFFSIERHFDIDDLLSVFSRFDKKINASKHIAEDILKMVDNMSEPARQILYEGEALQQQQKATRNDIKQ